MLEDSGLRTTHREWPRSCLWEVGMLWELLQYFSLEMGCSGAVFQCPLGADVPGGYNLLSGVWIDS